ncbi:hypothetical protein BG004_003127 [Podila humilis]|nr:hypothetical protein BG004_003127 [Podila humilis]
MLFNSNSPSEWDSILSQYPLALSTHVSTKHDHTLSDLDQWYQSTLPALLQSRLPSQFITSDELCQLMSWKLKRGKFRPSLAKLVASNSDTTVKSVSQQAFAIIINQQSNNNPLKAAIAKITELKGVGPATGSAILCAAAPDKVPFMADETMSSVPGLGPIVYTPGYYYKFAEKVIEKAAELKRLGAKACHTPHLVEKALWTNHMLDRYKIQKNKNNKNNNNHEPEPESKSQQPQPHSELEKSKKAPKAKSNTTTTTNTTAGSSKRKADEQLEPSTSTDSSRDEIIKDTTDGKKLRSSTRLARK